MTNWKEEDDKKHKAKKTGKTKDKDNGKGKNETKTDNAFKKAVNGVGKAVGRIKASFRRKSSSAHAQQDNNNGVQQTTGSSAPQEQIIHETNEEEKQPEVVENSEVVVAEDEEAKPEECQAEEQKTEEKQPEVQKSEESKPKKHHGKHGKSKKNQAVPVKPIEEPKTVQEEDPHTILKNKVFQVIKNSFSLAYTEDEEIRINVDNIFPLLKALGLNPQSESVVDLVRDACIETAGNIDPKDFETVVLALIKELDDDLWMSRLEEKQFLFWEAEAKKKKLDAERERLEQEREKAGFEKEEEKTDEWAEYERQKKEEEDKKAFEKKEDELYDNLKMAFRFIDADGDGVISTKDLYTLMMGVGEMLTDDELFGMVNMADLDCDGKVTLSDFKNFLNPGSGDADDDDDTAKPPAAVTTPGTGNDVDKTNTVDGGTTPGTEKDAKATDEASKKSEESSKATSEAEKPELTEEERQRAARRKKSMLWGYMSAATKIAQSTPAEKKPEPEPEKIEEEPEEKTEDTVEVTVTEPPDETPEETKSEPQAEDAEKAEPGNFLVSIREEDEHSNYGVGENAQPGATQDIKTTNVAENKRKLFSRQSSAASLKNRPNSSITACDSICDSGIGTLDTNCGSEMPEQADVFDISDEGSESSSKRERRKRSGKRRKSHQDVYNTEEGDEDMVEARHVHESLSRVSSMDSLEDDLKEVEAETLANTVANEDSDERTKKFVEQHMYVEVEPIEEETEEMILEREKFRRAELLQRAISRRSATTPNITMYRSKLNRPKTPKPSVNGFSCSHIDINLTCDAPPKADIKCKRQPQRSMTPRNMGPLYDKAISGHPMNFVDMSELINADENLPAQYDLPKWPTRPLTRPRSPTRPLSPKRTLSPIQKRIASAKERSIKPTTTNDTSDTDRPRRRVRAQSAVPFLRKSGESEECPRPMSARRIIVKRPQTAQIPYTKSKRMEKAFSTFEKNDNLTVVVSEPFINSDELYPNKSKFTSHHHGFKSIWPIGRKINVIQDKRPFSAFEMNSYSRSIERNEFPFRSNGTTEILSTLPISELERKPEPEVKALPTKRTLIKLELNTDGLKKPVGRKILVRTGFSPRSVR